MNVLSPAIHVSSWSAHDSAPKAADSSDTGDFLHTLRKQCSTESDSSKAPNTPSNSQQSEEKTTQQSRTQEKADSASKAARTKNEQSQGTTASYPENEAVDPVGLSFDAVSALAANLPVSNTESSAALPDSSSQIASPSADAVSESASVPGEQLLTPQPVLGNLAFALRIQSSSADSDTEPIPPSQSLMPSGISSLFSANVQAAAPGPEHKLDTQIAGIAAVDTNTGHRAAGADSDMPTPAGTPAPASSTSDFEAELDKFRAAEPVRGAHVQISGADSQRVDIRLIERAGALSVAVRSSDSTLTRSLQEHAPELNASLRLEHFRTELWTPASTRSSSQQQSSGNQQGSYSGGGGNHPQQQNRKNQQQPEWSDEIESHSATLQNRIEYTWHQ